MVETLWAQEILMGLFKLVAASGAIALGAVSQAQASFVAFTDQAAFEAFAGAGSLTTETFNSFTASQLVPTMGLVAGGLLVRNVDTPWPAFVISAPEAPYDVDGTPNIQVNGGHARGIWITTSEKVTAMGATFADFQDDGANMLIGVINDNQVYYPPVAPGGAIRFFGIVSTTPFSGLLVGLSESRGPTDTFGMDNVVYGGDGAYAPEPSAWALMILGFAAVGSALRKRSFSVRPEAT